MWWNNDPRDSLPSWHQYMPRTSMATGREDEVMKQGTIQIPKRVLKAIT